MTLTDAPTDPAPADAAHGHHLSEEQVRFFDAYVYLVQMAHGLVCSEDPRRQVPAGRYTTAGPT